jgi:hypothetical protein
LPSEPRSCQKAASELGSQRQAKEKPSCTSGRPILSSCSRAAIVPETIACFTPLKAPSEVLGETGKLPSFVIVSAFTLGRLPRTETASRT